MLCQVLRLSKYLRDFCSFNGLGLGRHMNWIMSKQRKLIEENKFTILVSEKTVVLLSGQAKQSFNHQLEVDKGKLPTVVNFEKLMF